MHRANFSTSLPLLRAPHRDLIPKPTKDKSWKAAARSQRFPNKSGNSDAHHATHLTNALGGMAKMSSRWKSGWQAWYAEKWSHRLAVYAVGICISGAMVVYFFALERVPITGRKRFGWLSQSALAMMDENLRKIMERLGENEEKIFIKSDYPGLRKIEAVFNRLVKASGLDDIAWEIRVLDEPSKCLSPRL